MKTILFCLFLVQLGFAQMFNNPFLELKEPTVFFDVQNEDGMLTISPILLYGKGGMKEPPVVQGTDYTSNEKNFITKYFKPNATFKVLPAGEKKYSDIVIKHVPNTTDHSGPITCEVEYMQPKNAPKLKRFLISNSSVGDECIGHSDSLSTAEKAVIITQLNNYAKKNNLIHRKESIIIDNLYKVQSYCLAYFHTLDVKKESLNYLVILELSDEFDPNQKDTSKPPVKTVANILDVRSYVQASEYDPRIYQYIGSIYVDDGEGIRLVFFIQEGSSHSYQVIKFNANKGIDVVFQYFWGS